MRELSTEGSIMVRYIRRARIRQEKDGLSHEGGLSRYGDQHYTDLVGCGVGLRY